MKKERLIILLLAAALMAALTYIDRRLTAGRQCAAGPPVVELRIDTVWIRDTLTLRRPALVREVVREVPAAVDTAAILADYHAARAYADTLRIADVATVRLLDTVAENRLRSRHVAYDVMRLQPAAVALRPPDAGARPSAAAPRLALTAGLQTGARQLAPALGLRYRRAAVLAAYDLRLRTPSVTLTFDIVTW